jgi:hypothetical protein
MPSVIEDLSEILHSQWTSRGGLTLTRGFHIKDLAGGSGADLFMQAWNLLGTTLQGEGGPVTLPRPSEGMIIGGREVFANDINIDPWPPADATLTVTYNEDNTELSGFDNVEVETGTTYETDETDFAASEWGKPFNERKTMYLLYDPDRDGPPSDLTKYRHDIRAPILVGKSFRRMTKTLGEDPAPLGERFCSPPKTNKTTWKGYPPETILCLSIVGRNAGRGWRTTFDFAVDKVGKFRHVARVTDKETGLPIPLRPIDVANRNGIDEFVVQPQDNFNALPL